MIAEDCSGNVFGVKCKIIPTVYADVENEFDDQKFIYFNIRDCAKRTLPFSILGEGTRIMMEYLGSNHCSVLIGCEDEREGNDFLIITQDANDACTRVVKVDNSMDPAKYICAKFQVNKIEFFIPSIPEN